MKIFLSYSSRDKELVEPIYYALVKNHTVFFDRKSLPPGDDFDSRIRRAVKASDLFIYCISPNAIAPGSYTHSELKFAETKWKHPGKRILPVMLLPTSYSELPGYLKAVTVLETPGNKAAEVADAVRELGNKHRYRKLYRGALSLVAGLVALFVVYNYLIRGTESKSDTPEISRFELQPSVITRGEGSILLWRTAKADEVEITGFGKVPLSDQRTVNPDITTDYRIIARNDAGNTVEKTVTLEVSSKADDKEILEDEENTPENNVDEMSVSHKSLTMQGGTGFIFTSEKITQGTGVDRDLWWNNRELVPAERMYSLGKISGVEDIAQVATGHFEFKAFEPEPQQGYVVEIKRNQKTSYAIIRIDSISDDRAISFEWLYPYKGHVTGQQ